MRVEEAVERIWPGRPVEVEPLGGGITNHNFKVVVDGETLVLRIGGKDTELLGIDRAREHEAALLAAELGIGPEVARYEDGVWSRGSPREKSAAPNRRVVGGLLASAALGAGARRPLRLVPGGRGVRGHGGRARRDAPGPVRRAPTSSRGRSRPGAPKRPSSRATTTCSRRTSSTTETGSGSWTGSTRAWAIRSSTSPTSRSTTGSTRTASGRCSAPTASDGRGRAGADAVHVRLPRGDVGRRPAGDLGARLRLRGIRGRALRAHAANRLRAPRSRQASHERARREPSSSEEESAAVRSPTG